VSTTISCRFFAQGLVLLLVVSAAVPGLAQPQEQRPQPQPKNGRVSQPVPSAERWSTLVGASTSVAPVMTDRYVFAFRPPGTIAAFDLLGGQEKWSTELKPEHPLMFDDGRLFVAAGAELHAIDGETGSTVWRQPAGTLTAPLLVHQGWVITIADGEVAAWRAADGTVVWRQPNGAQHLRPTIEGEILYLPRADATVAALDLITGAKKWERKFGGATSEIAALDGRVYFGSEDKSFYCLDADDGEVKWRHRPGAAAIGRPAVDADRVYFGAMDNQVRALDRVNGATRWQQGLRFRPSAGPLLFGTAVVVPGTVPELRTFDAATGKPGSVLTFPAPLASPLAIHPSPKGPIAATITGGLDVPWKLSLWEPSMTIPVAPLTVLPGKAVPLTQAPSSPAGAP
jgi:outer membrane protein assembly factor BamB